jgi:hypothetical protein
LSDGRGHTKVSVAVRPAASADAAVEQTMSEENTCWISGMLVRMRDVVEILHNINEQTEVKYFSLKGYVATIVIATKKDDVELLTLKVSSDEAYYVWSHDFNYMMEHRKEKMHPTGIELVEEWREKIEKALKSK